MGHESHVQCHLDVMAGHVQCHDDMSHVCHVVTDVMSGPGQWQSQVNFNSNSPPGSYLKRILFGLISSTVVLCGLTEPFVVAMA